MSLSPIMPSLPPEPVPVESPPSVSVAVATAPVFKPVEPERPTMKEMIYRYLINRLREPTTWAGIIAMFAAGGSRLTPDQAGAIQTAGIALVGVVLAFFPNVFGKNA